MSLYTEKCFTDLLILLLVVLVPEEDVVLDGGVLDPGLLGHVAHATAE